MPTDNISIQLNKLINYAYVLPDKTDEWKSKGFEENKIFASELWDEPTEYVVMTREPISLIKFGEERLIGCEIIDLCPFLGSYGMGGPGYFGFKFKVQNDFMWLVVCIWNAEGYMMLDDRVLCTANQYKRDYNPWYSSFNQFNKLFKKELLNYKINNITISDESMTLDLERECINRQVKVFKNDKRLPPMGSDIVRIDAFNVGTLSDYMMVIYNHTNLFVE
ncbi:MAG: hypothetical protein AB7V16_08305 [Vulcanibacillus sp.]